MPEGTPKPTQPLGLHFTPLDRFGIFDFGLAGTTGYRIHDTYEARSDSLSVMDGQFFASQLIGCAETPKCVRKAPASRQRVEYYHTQFFVVVETFLASRI